MPEPLENRPKPRLRGVLHQVAFFVALVVGALLVIFADGTRASLAAAVFAGSVAAMLGAAWTWAVGLRSLSALAPVPRKVPAAMVE